MKQVIIGDIHGLTVWKRIVENHPDADRFIFLGDYVDTNEDILPIEQLNNLQAIIKFKNRNRDKVICLIGNHDYQYWPGIDQQYSGYQLHMRHSFEYEFSINRDLFQMCFVDEWNTVYSHAGFSKKFLYAIGAMNFQDVNELFKWRPALFGYNSVDRYGYGNHPLQSCIWIREQALYSNKISNLQVVGHTHYGQMNHVAKSLRRGFFLADCLPNEYLICIDGIFTIEKI